MIYITYIHKYRICPKWKEEIPIRGKYRYSDDPKNPYEARFLMSICPILENIRLPEHKRNESYKYFPFCDVENCCALKGFDEIIDTRKP